MTKADLVERLAHKTKMPWKHAELVVEAIFATMKQSLHRGERIEIRGFGTFQVRSYKGYVGRNPKTGTPVDVAPKRLPFFKVSKNLAAMIESGREKHNRTVVGTQKPVSREVIGSTESVQS